MTDAPETESSSPDAPRPSTTSPGDVPSEAQMLEFVLAHGLPMHREGKYRYHGLSETTWWSTHREAIRAAMQDFRAQALADIRSYTATSSTLTAAGPGPKVVLVGGFPTMPSGWSVPTDLVVSTHVAYHTISHIHFDWMYKDVAGNLVYPASALMLVECADGDWYLEQEFGSEYNRFSGVVQSSKDLVTVPNWYTDVDSAAKAAFALMVQVYPTVDSQLLQDFLES